MFKRCFKGSLHWGAIAPPPLCAASWALYDMYTEIPLLLRWALLDLSLQSPDCDHKSWNPKVLGERPKMVDSQKWLGEGAKGILSPGAKVPGVFCTIWSPFCTGANPFCTGASPFSLPGLKRPCARSPNYLWEFTIFGLSQNFRIATKIANNARSQDRIAGTVKGQTSCAPSSEEGFRTHLVWNDVSGHPSGNICSNWKACEVPTNLSTRASRLWPQIANNARSQENRRRSMPIKSCPSDAAFLLTVGSFLLTVELFYLQLTI